MTLLAAAPNAIADFHAELRENRVVITNEGLPVAHFVFRDPQILRPHFAHVHVPGGIQVSRNHPPLTGTDPVDHADMHPGLWLGFGDISGNDFWRNKAGIIHKRFVQEPIVSDGVLSFATESSMIGAESRELAEMTTAITIQEREGAWHVIWDAAFKPVTDGFWFGDQEEMGLGVRVATGISEKNGGLITSSSGSTTAKATWGRHAAWSDYSGIIRGRHVGIMVVPDPGNPHPSWWHNRDYGLMVSNPFGRSAMKQGEKSRIEVKRGQTYRLKHTIILHASPDGKAPDLSKLAASAR